MLTYNDKTCMIKANLNISKCVEGEHSIAIIKCEAFHKMNMDLKNTFS